MTPPPLTGDDEVGIRAWLADLTYAEVHAFTYGFGLPVVALLALFVAPDLASLPLVASVALLLYGITGDEAFLSEFGLAIEQAILEQIRHETHYYLGGLVLGVGVFLVGFVIGGLDAAPIVEWVVRGLAGGGA